MRPTMKHRLAYIVMTYIAMAYIIMAYIVMAHGTYAPNHEAQTSPASWLGAY